MEYILIADAGSTKTDWVAVGAGGSELARFSAPGINALVTEPEDIDRSLTDASRNLGFQNGPAHVYFYGAGCATPRISSEMENRISDAFKCRASVESDLLGAARSLLGINGGIACILGTGSNSCLYDGKKIALNIPSLGFILGDEGSGAALGKRLVADAFKGHLPKIVAQKLLDEFELTLDSILENVYRRPSPNRFLASLVPFIERHLWNPYVYSLVRQEFESFLTRNISPYLGARSLPIAFTGSVAFHFADILKEACNKLGFKAGTISRKPLDGLVAYHSKTSLQ